MPVFKTNLTLKPHPSADRLEIAAIDKYQVCVEKGRYTDKDIVIFISEKSVLPPSLAAPYSTYLVGRSKDRVSSVSLRGQLSQGIVSSVADIVTMYPEYEQAIREAEIGSDLSELLGVRTYEPPVPMSLGGDLSRLTLTTVAQHDVSQYAKMYHMFNDNEVLQVTEKLHGSQAAYGLDENDNLWASSKGVLSQKLSIKEAPGVYYWRAARTQGVENDLREIKRVYGSDTSVVQAFGEVVPVQGQSWSYGVTQPVVYFFDIRVDGRVIPYKDVKAVLPNILWVPVLAEDTKQNLTPLLDKLCTGNEQVSGRQLHIKEGIVVRPVSTMYDEGGKPIMIKVINPKYLKQSTGEEFN